MNTQTFKMVEWREVNGRYLITLKKTSTTGRLWWKKTTTEIERCYLEDQAGMALRLFMATIEGLIKTGMANRFKAKETSA